MLEAGPIPDFETTPHDLVKAPISVVRHDWGFKADALKGREIEFPRGKVTGGSSAVNATIALRGVPADYDEWASLGNTDWAWSKVLPYFRRLEDDQDESGPLHGRGGPIPVRRWKPAELVPLQQAYLDAGQALGFARWRITITGDDRHRAVPMKSARRPAYLPPPSSTCFRRARARNLTIRTGLPREPRVFAGKSSVFWRRARDYGKKRRRVVRGRRITLSAGAIASPAILLRSGIGPRTELEALGIESHVDLPGVGANLIDHPLSSVALVPRPGVCQKTQPVVQVGVRHTAPGSVEWNDMQLFMISQADLTEIPALMAIVGAPNGVAWRWRLQRPRSRGRLSLMSPDPHTQPAYRSEFISTTPRRPLAPDGGRPCVLAWRVAPVPP